MLVRRTIVICSMMLLAAGAQAAERVAPRHDVDWISFEGTRANRFRAGAVMLTFRGSDKPDDAFTLTLASRGAPAFVYHGVGITGGGVAEAHFAYGRLDRMATSDQVVLSTFTGGLHCCEETRIFTRGPGGWKMIELPAGEEAGAAGSQVNQVSFPTDKDGDGYPDFVLSDDRFDYTFASYTAGWLPPRVFRIQDGALVDESASRKFDAIFLKDMKEVKPGCLGKENQDGPCAGYVADAVRIGQFEAGWRFMLAHYAKDDTMAECTVPQPESHPCPERATVQRTFPYRLAHFLGENGYITSAQVAWAMSTVRE